MDPAHEAYDNESAPIDTHGTFSGIDPPTSPSHQNISFLRALYPLDRAPIPGYAVSLPPNYFSSAMYQQNTPSIYPSPSVASPMFVPPPEHRLIPTNASNRFHPYGLAGETSSGQPTPEGSVLSSKVSGSRGSAREKTKKKKPTAKPSLSEFDAALKPVLQLAKRAYSADILSHGPVLLARHEKRTRAKEAIMWSVAELNPGTTVPIPDRCVGLINDSWDKIKDQFRVYMEGVVASRYGLRDATQNKNIPSLSPEEITEYVSSLLGLELKFIWDTVDEKGHPIPFSHPAIADGLKYLHFYATGRVGVNFQKWFGDRYSNPGISYVLAVIESIIGWYRFGSKQAFSLDRDRLLEPYEKWMDLVDGTERHVYYGNTFADSMRRNFADARAELNILPLNDLTENPLLTADDPNRRMNYITHKQITIQWYLDADGNPDPLVLSISE